jgi:hypothetical protein
MLLGLGTMAVSGAEEHKDSWLDTHRFGAKGDGKTDDTKALQAALDAAGEMYGGVFVPAGVYLSSELHMRPSTALVGIPVFSGRSGGSRIRLANEKASCLLNITEAFGATIEGLTFEGAKLGKEVNGLMVYRKVYDKTYQQLHINKCMVNGFSGTGVVLHYASDFSIRHCMIQGNGGDGIRCFGWDGFVMDNQISGNGGCGWEGTLGIAIQLTGNRIEWNHKNGIRIAGGWLYAVTGNSIDRSGTSAIALVKHENTDPTTVGFMPQGMLPPQHVAVTGNVIYRSGKLAEPESHDSSQVLLDGAMGVTIVGNTIISGHDDFGQGIYTPSYGFVCRNLTNCVIQGNSMHNAALKQLVLDLGGHGEGFIVRDNPGRLGKPPIELA